MKNLFLIFFLCCITKIAAAQTDEELIKKTIQTFFEGMDTRDTSLIKSVMHENCVFNSVAIKKEKPAVFENDNVSDFYKSIVKIPKNVKLEERLLDHKIQIDEALAIDWTPYEFYVNEKLSHTGTNAFTLVKTEENWKIVAIIDTRKR
ncbi:nuclear transport factor 2 family protein [Lacihabitans sp. LS3-19]|uniref:nuclear transport factor 2 family protein n=1 Tax=Lacihabitans sp. LS3-19 TaxID=2487335 RepID=UPI0020CCD9E3|nr:nuclear transport factor 2 family protein [Lacihabitans sp. LS3-19]MCP9770348.1 nuclear transport factor 2 family protein [Lacihabitans sp. LS3-19]